MTSIKWQDFLNVLTLKGNDTKTTSKVKNAKEDITKLKLCYESNKTYLEEWLEDKVQIQPKSTDESVKFRLEGNKIYQKGRDVDALRIYNSSVRVAPIKTNEFALALANRSAVLMRLNYYKEAIQDIDLALQHGNIEIPRQKLLIRKALLLHKLNLYKESLQVIQSLYPSEDEIKKLENEDLKKIYNDFLLDKIGNEETVTQEDKIPLPQGGFSQAFPCASTCVSLEFSEDKGRHVIAREDLNTADIIFVESPFALVVLPDQYDHHCHHCCKECVAFIACHQCREAQFCSDVCRAAAWDAYHQWECRGLAVCHSIGIAHLGLRLALTADDSERYRQVCQLVTHIEDMKAEDVYQYTITAVLLTLYLEKYTSYFQDHRATTIEDMGCRILRHIAQLICNGHAITKIGSTHSEKGFAKTMAEQKVRIATAIYPSASMMNHSCDQNISNSFINQVLVVRASKPIKKGEEVFNCYEYCRFQVQCQTEELAMWCIEAYLKGRLGQSPKLPMQTIRPHFSSMGREERQRALRDQYFFTCLCSKCSKHSESEFRQFSALRCSFCAGPVMEGEGECSECCRPQMLVELVNMALTAQEGFHQGRMHLKEGKTENALDVLDKSVTLASKCLYKHNSDLRTYKDSLARVYAELGRYKEAIQVVEDCVTSVEKQFGPSSVELSRELLKLRDVMLEELNRLMSAGQQNTPEYRKLIQKVEGTLKKLKKIKEANIDAAYLNVPGMTEALKRADLY